MSARLDYNPNPPCGWLALLAAVFDRAWSDLRCENGYSADAHEFLYDENVAANLHNLLDVDPGYYRRMLTAPEPDREAEAARRVRALSDWGVHRSDIRHEADLRGNGTETSAFIIRILGRQRPRRRKAPTC